MMNFLIILSILISIMFMFMNHPLSLGFMLLIQTICVSLMSGTLNYNYWFSYILFLVMIGGMLILFIYMTSIASNKKFKFSFKLFTFSLLISFLLLSLMFMDQYIFNINYVNYDTFTFNSNINNKYSLNKFLNNPNYLIMMMIFIYLFITLIAVTKIAPTSKGPLRQKF